MRRHAFFLAMVFGLVAPSARAAVPEARPARPLPTAEPSPAGYDALPLDSLLAFGDFDGDGTMDRAVADRGGADDGDVRVVVAEAGHSRVVLAVPTASPVDLRAGDVDRDGDLDLLISDAITRHVVGVFINAGDGTFSRARDDLATWRPPSNDLLGALRAASHRSFPAAGSTMACLWIARWHDLRRHSTLDPRPINAQSLSAFVALPPRAPPVFVLSRS